MFRAPWPPTPSPPPPLKPGPSQAPLASPEQQNRAAMKAPMWRRLAAGPGKQGEGSFGPFEHLLLVNLKH